MRGAKCWVVGVDGRRRRDRKRELVSRQPGADDAFKEGRMPPCLSIALYPDRVVSARGLPVSISSDGKSGFVPKRRNVYSRPLLPSSLEQWEA